MKGSTWGIIFIIMAIALGAACLANLSDQPVAPIPVQIVKPDHSKLVNWVISKSEKISRATAKDIVEQAMQSKHGLLLLSICEVESQFTPGAVSAKGAVGLGQIMWEPHKVLLAKLKIAEDRRDLFDYAPNLRACDAVISMYLTETKGDIDQALRKYLGGRDGAYTYRICKNFVELSLIQGQK